MKEIIFNDDQNAAINSMLQFMQDSKEHFFLLEGYAGTGKTTCIQEVIRKLGSPAVLTAPTNKATRVLMEFSLRFGMQVPCCTIYSLLGLKLSGTAEKRVVTPEGESKMPLYHLVVVDEASMCNQDVFNHILEQAYNYSVKVIFMGDPAQLPPVGEKVSPVFVDIKNKSVLTKVMRHDNQILNLATRVRQEWSGDGDDSSLFVTAHDDQGGVYCVDTKKFNAQIEKAFTSETYKDDPSKVRIIAWTNEAVRGYNAMVRGLLYGDNLKPYHLGERVVVCQPIVDVVVKKESRMTEMTMTTDQEAVVLSIDEVPHPIYKRFMTLRLQLETDDGEVNEAYVIHPDYEKELADTLNNMAIDARARKASWSSFWEMKEMFHDIRPCHAITAHRSQGSTYDSVLVDVCNIQMNRNHREMLQCLYVAVSRASRVVVARTR